MSNRTMLEFNHDFCPRSGEEMVFIRGLIEYLRSGDPEFLPPGVTYFGRRHHSDPLPLGEPPRGWDNSRANQ
jgi:hypothetical protein